jgi:hypothetical protein
MKKTIEFLPHHDISAFTTASEGMYPAIHWNAKEKRFEATDGEVLITVPGTSDSKKSIAMDSGSINAATEIGAKTCAMCLDGDGVLNIMSRNQFQKRTATVDCADDSGREFPKLDSVLAITKENPDLSIIINPKHLQRVIDYAIKHSGHEIVLKLRGPLNPIEFQIPLQDSQGNTVKAIGLVMPMKTKIQEK